MEVKFSRSYLKDIKVMPKHVQLAAHEIAQKLQKAGSLKESGVDYKKMKGEKNYYRIRTGSFRIIAEYISPTIILLVIASRGDVYK